MRVVRNHICSVRCLKKLVRRGQVVQAHFGAVEVWLQTVAHLCVLETIRLELEGVWRQVALKEGAHTRFLDALVDWKDHALHLPFLRGEGLWNVSLKGSIDFICGSVVCHCLVALYPTECLVLTKRQRFIIVFKG